MLLNAYYINKIYWNPTFFDYLKREKNNHYDQIISSHCQLSQPVKENYVLEQIVSNFEYISFLNDFYIIQA